MTFPIGHERQARAMLEQARAGRLHHGWILAGPLGVGKGMFARAMALRLLAEAAGPPPGDDGLSVADDHPIARLIAAGAHPDYADLICLTKDNGDQARNISVDQIRGLSRLISTAPSLSTRRVVVIDSADDMEAPAANALLKTLEEPPTDMVFLLVSHAPARLLPTIRSRCRLLRFDALDDAAMRAVLGAQQPDIQGTELDALLRAAEGSPGRAMAYAGLDIAGLESALERIAAHGDPDNSERLALAKQLGTKPARARYQAFLERAPAFLARAARTRRGASLGRALDHWDEARKLAAGAVILTLEPQSVVFELAGHVAALAPARGGGR
ncbi:DNA polymerase-3 subunit delta' [Sphingobium fontiphilum]|uniref:DNA polymerase-3 subunit delta n=1 Tax=Sphingobium fontiphilum TaxID=944425 RepID=A0A7W6DH42_9SPHN|nr:DNA polymerase III subunit delta' [Sphingobium fontiphilum]MBB3982928.1 DNA polymerase-3 subunit delta' [Sphingobium fontiphilum]